MHCFSAKKTALSPQLAPKKIGFLQIGALFYLNLLFLLIKFQWHGYCTYTAVFCDGGARENSLAHCATNGSQDEF
jgi:hypothetical protein